MLNKLKNLANYLAPIVSFDTRSLALMRIGLGVASLINLYDYLINAHAWFSENGMMPMKHMNHDWWTFNLFQISPSYTFQLILLWIMVGLSLSLIFGFKTKISTFLLLALSLSLEHRTILTGGTVGIRMGLFWGLFLPLGEAWSVDTYTRTQKWFNKPRNVISMGTIGFVFQILLLFWISVAHKTSADWLVDYSLVYKTLWWGGLATPAGVWLRQFPDLTILMTRASFYIEILAPALLVFPFRNWVSRTIGVVVLLGLHAGFQVFMFLEPFPFANIAITLAFLPAIIWSRLTHKKDVVPEITREESIQDKVKAFFSHKEAVVEIEEDIYPRPVWDLGFSLYSFAKGLLAVFFMIMIGWKNLWHLEVLPKPHDAFYKPMVTLKMAEKWNMFAGGNDYFQFWPQIRAIREGEEDFDLWKWYVDYSNTNFTQGILPDDVSALNKRLRWGKYINSLTINRNYYEKFHPHFLSYLCRNYNEKLPTSVGRIDRVELWWGWREVKGFEDFGEVGEGRLNALDCR